MINTLGHLLRLTTFGESHGLAVGGVLDGFPPGIRIDMDKLLYELKRRKPGEGAYSSTRKEEDIPEFISGLSDGVSLGTPLTFVVRNTDQRPGDYHTLKDLYRPSHADFSWEQKFGVPSGPGGGRSSARTLLPIVIAGCLAEQLLDFRHFSVLAWVSSLGQIAASADPEKVTQDAVAKNPLLCPDIKAARAMKDFLEDVAAKGDTAGGTITCRIRGCPTGLGEPVFGKMHADLAHAMMGINSVKGFELGEGFAGTEMTGSQYNDQLTVKNNKAANLSNHDGGINGGITNGEDIVFRVAFKPVPSVQLPQKTISRDLKKNSIRIGGRHDVCVLPRAVPVVEALARFVVADHYLMQKTRKK